MRRIQWPARRETMVNLRFPRSVCVLSALVGVFGAAYLWAVLFGDGLHGVKESTALDRSNALPDANAALIGAGIAWLAGPYGIAVAGFMAPRHYWRWWSGLTVIGAGVFAAAQTFA